MARFASSPKWAMKSSLSQRLSRVKAWARARLHRSPRTLETTPLLRQMMEAGGHVDLAAEAEAFSYIHDIVSRSAVVALDEALHPQLTPLRNPPAHPNCRCDVDIPRSPTGRFPVPAPRRYEFGRGTLHIGNDPEPHGTVSNVHIDFGSEEGLTPAAYDLIQDVARESIRRQWRAMEAHLLRQYQGPPYHRDDEVLRATLAVSQSPMSRSISVHLDWFSTRLNIQHRSSIAISHDALMRMPPMGIRGATEIVRPQLDSFLRPLLERLIQRTPYGMPVQQQDMDNLVRHGEMALQSVANPTRTPPWHWDPVVAWDFGLVGSSPAAIAKSKALLVRCLNEEQRKEFAKDETFTVVAPPKDNPANRYKVDTRSVSNVTELSTGYRYCIQLAEEAPIYDQMLTCKLLLENDPGKFFSTANRTIPNLHHAQDHFQRGQGQPGWEWVTTGIRPNRGSMMQRAAESIRAAAGVFEVPLGPDWDGAWTDAVRDANGNVE